MSEEGLDHSEPSLTARHLLICREVLYDGNNPVAPYTLCSMLTVLHPDRPFPILWSEPICLFAQYFGPEGEFEVWVDLVRLVYDEADEVVDEFEETSYGPFVLGMMPGRFIQSRFYLLRRVPFTEPGVYEFRLRVAGVTEPLATEHLLVEDY